MEKLYTVAGTSRRAGTVKFRFSNDIKGRVPMLLRTGHTEIRLVELPEPMTKDAAIAHLATVGITCENSTEVEAPAPETAGTIRASLAADGIDTADMSDEFLADVAKRENAKPEFEPDF
jgi:hypothetical protein